jgi:Mg2+-importing ATPase
MIFFVFQAWDKPALIQTGWFVKSLLTQTLIIHIIHTANVPFLESRAGYAVIATSRIIAAIGIVLPNAWLGNSLGFVPLPPLYWALLCLILLGYAIMTYLMKTWFSRRFGLD